MTDTTPTTPETPEVRPALDAANDRRLQRDPTDEDAKLDIELDESFPASDPPSSSEPKKAADAVDVSRSGEHSGRE